jgi:hypothetical protein
LIVNYLVHSSWDVTITGEGLQKLRPMLGAQSLWAGRDLYRAIPAVARDLRFCGLIQRTAQFSRLLRHTRGTRDLFYSGFPRSYLQTENMDRYRPMLIIVATYCPVKSFLCSDIPLAPAYGVYISQLIRYARVCLRI